MEKEIANYVGVGAMPDLLAYPPNMKLPIMWALGQCPICWHSYPRKNESTNYVGVGAMPDLLAFLPTEH